VLDVTQLGAVAVADEFLGVGFQIAIRVARQPQVRWFTDQHAFVQHLERTRENEAVEEDGLLVHLPVVVRVLEHADPANRRAFVGGGQILHVSEQLDDPHAAARIPIDEDRVFDHRLACHELDVIARWKKERLHLRRRRQRRGILVDRLQTTRPRFWRG
jgi:hypothetical protein